MIKNGQLNEEVFKLYKARRDFAENKAFENREKVMQNQEFATVHYQIKNLNLDIAKAKFENDSTLLKKLQKQKTPLEEKRDQILNSLGFSQSDLSPKYACPKCNDSGYLPQGGLCSCFYKTLQTVSESVLGITAPDFPTFESYDCESQKEQKLKDKLIDYCEKFPPETIKNLIFTGSTGTGKTFSAGAIANALIAKNKGVIYLTATKLNDICRLYHVMDETNRRSVFDLLCESDLLIIDDLGSEPLYKNVTVVYFNAILSERLANKRPFIITTNLSMEEIGARYNDRLLSRLSSEETIRINFSGKDKRRKNT